MSKFIPVFVVLVGLIGAAPGCYYDNEEELYGGSTCDTTSVSYAGNIVPILKNNCYGCHDASSFSVSGVQFDTHSLLNGLATDGSLVNRTNNAANPMPPSQLLDECDRNLIKAWVLAGAPNN